MTDYWLSCARMTVLAETDEAGIVTRTAPITRRFVGQRLDRLAGWMSGLGGFKMAELDAPRQPATPAAGGNVERRT